MGHRDWLDQRLRALTTPGHSLPSWLCGLNSSHPLFEVGESPPSGCSAVFGFPERGSTGMGNGLAGSRILPDEVKEKP